jgi:hypothetical protein
MCVLSIRQHTSAYAAPHRHTHEPYPIGIFAIWRESSAYVSIRQHKPAYASIRGTTQTHARTLPCRNLCDLEGIRSRLTKAFLRPLPAALEATLLAALEAAWPAALEAALSAAPEEAVYKGYTTHANHFRTPASTPHTHTHRHRDTRHTLTHTPHTHTHNIHIYI